MELQLITRENFFKSLDLEKCPWHDNYLAMYCTLWQGIVTDPRLMMVPMDDHLVHRGDGVFDVIRCVEGRVYQLEAHLKRLETSAGAVGLPLPAQYSRVREIVKALIENYGDKNCIIRIILSRGPGGFSVNPFECPSSHMYINLVRFRPPPERYYREGISTVTSRVPIKNAFFARIKSCNYLPNVLMKMEALNKGCSYAVGVDDDGCLAEGPTENLAVLTHDDILKFPRFARTLAGITATRVHELADHLVVQKHIKEVRFDPIPVRDALRAKEMMLVGTSINVLPVVSHDGSQIGDGIPGPVYSKLSELLNKDMMENNELLTEPYR